MLKEPTLAVIDTFVVIGKKDFHLVRHFLQSHSIFSRLGGKIHLFLWKDESYLLEQIWLPDNVVIWFKDDVEGLVENDFRNQMYLKLLADKYAETEWIWIADSDYLICDEIYPKDFFNADGIPYWFYKHWDGGVPEQLWRAGSEKFFKEEIPFQFLDKLQLLIKAKILKEFRRAYDLTMILKMDSMPSEYIVYGAFAYKYFHESYCWIDLATENACVSIAHNVNQQAPTYCILDKSITLSSAPSAKYYIFWSHWEFAEFKIKEFLSAALRRIDMFVEINSSELLLKTTAKKLSANDTSDISGLHLDGWTHQVLAFILEPLACLSMVIEFEVLAREEGSRPSSAVVEVNNKRVGEKIFTTGQNFLQLPLESAFANKISISFSDGVLEPGGNRCLYARLMGMQFSEVLCL